MQFLICTNTTYYYLDPVAQLCIECAIIPKCILCMNSTYCTNCSVGYFINTSNLCDFINCTSTTTNCILCLNASACSICDYNISYYLDVNTSTCQYCDNSLNKYINISSPGK